MDAARLEIVPLMARIARLAAAGLGLFALIYLGSEFYFVSHPSGHMVMAQFDLLLIIGLSGALAWLWFARALPALRQAGEMVADAHMAAQRLRDIEKASGDAVAILDRNLKVVTANEAACEMTAQPPEQVIGATINSLFAGSNFAEVFAAYREVIEKGRAKKFRKYLELPNARSGWFEFLASPCADGLLVIVNDISEQKHHEEILRANEERATAMLQFSSDAVIAFDERGIIESFNLSAESVFGYSAGEILGQPVRLLMAENESFANYRHYREFSARQLAKLVTGIQQQGKRKNGEQFSAMLIVNEIWSKGRRGFVATIHDQTEEIAAQTRLQEALERFDLCVRGSDSAIWDLDTVTGKLFVAPRLKQLLGYSEQEPIDSMPSFLQFVHADDRAMISTRADKDTSSNNMGFESRFRLRARSGEYLWFQNKAAFRRNTKGALVRIAGSVTEITARVRAEQELHRHRDHLVKMVNAQTRQIKKSEARLASAISGISEGLCLVDENKLIVLVNKHMLEMYPEVAEILNPGVALDDVFVELLDKNKHNGERRKFITDHFMALASDRPSEELLQPGGGWMRITRSKTQDGGEIILHTDITHYKQQETRMQAQARELEQALSMEKQVNTLHKQFVSMASHEFRTPLAIIDGSAQLLEREAEKLTPDRVRQRAEKIRGAVSRMTNLIESTLTVARLDAGKVDIAPRDCDLRALIVDVCERQQELSPAHRLGVDLDALPDRIVADSKAIDQVLTNLFSNAVKYSPNHPGIHIRGWREGAFAAVSVRDHGLGIASADLPLIFSRFFRAQNSTGIVGTGIGLNLVKELVNIHGGTVHVDSHVGEGSTFTVYLPIQGPQAAPAMAAAG